MIGGAALEAHRDHALGFVRAVADLAPLDARVLDLGSGGGLPGLVIAVEYPHLCVTLLDGRITRTEALQSAASELDLLERVDVVTDRAEEAGRSPALRYQFDLVFARGFGSPSVTAECGAPFLRVGGFLVVSDPPGGSAQRWPAEDCGKLGLVVVRSLTAPWAFTVLRAEFPCPDTFPRRTGVPGKRPLF